MLSKQKDNFYVLEFVFWISIFGIMPLINGVINFAQFINIAIYFSSSFFIGSTLLSKLNYINSIPFFFKTPVQILTGALLFSFTSFFISVAFLKIIIYALALGLIAVIVKTKNTKLLSNSYKTYWAYIPFLMLFFYAEESQYAIIKNYGTIDGDYFYYNAIAQSLYQNFSLKNAFYAQGTALNYPSLPFQVAAQISLFTGINTNVSTWAIFGKFISVVSFSSIALFVVFIINKLSNKWQQQFNHFVFAVASLLLLLLAPIHLLNLLKLKFNALTLPGFGYILPFGSVGFSISIFLLGLILITLYSNVSKLYSYLYVTLFLVLMCCSKFAMLFPTCVFLGVLSFIYLIKKDYHFLITTLIAAPFVIICYKLINIGTAVNFPKVELSTKNSGWIDFIKEQSSKYFINGSIVKQTIIVLGINTIFWIGYKLLAAFILNKISHNNNKFLSKSFFASSLLTIAVSLLVGFVLNVNFYDGNNIVWNINFDLMQFVRAANVLINIIAIIAIVFLMYHYSGYKKYIVIGCTSLICILNIPFFKSQLASKYTPYNAAWMTELNAEFKAQKPKLLACFGSKKFSGTFISAYSIGPWFCTGIRNQNLDTYNGTYESYKRAYSFKQFLDTNLNHQQKQPLYNSLKAAGVDYIVFNPDNIYCKNLLVTQGFIADNSSAKWMFKLK